MKKKSPFAAAFVCLLAVFLAVPFDAVALPDTTAQRAGEISRIIPAVNIMRGAKSLNAGAKTAVDWDDVVNTQASGRARVSLDDGSVLNVGSDSSVKVIKHDAGAQQTDLEVTVGKIRSQAQKISQPGGKFEVHTPAGVAGVVGTDFYVAYENNVMTVMVFEGVVKVCNLAGVCVELKAGQFSTVRNGDSSGPAAPNQATLSALSDAVASTTLEPAPGITQIHHIGKGTAIAIGILAAIPLVVIPIVATRGQGTTPAPTGQCNPRTNPNGCG
ncbi:MAG TPA: FecR family protein [Candidatus Eisenbacteria bacterium]|nr:FecR family protein [Candidatus Eisenbacteria bacterium]